MEFVTLRRIILFNLKDRGNFNSMSNKIHKSKQTSVVSIFIDGIIWSHLDRCSRINNSCTVKTPIHSLTIYIHTHQQMQQPQCLPTYYTNTNLQNITMSLLLYGQVCYYTIIRCRQSKLNRKWTIYVTTRSRMALAGFSDEVPMECKISKITCKIWRVLFTAF